MVQVLAANGISHHVIARNIGCDRNTLRRHFKDELKHGKDQVEAALGAAIVKAGMNGNWGAAKYWLATHGGPQWRVQPGTDDDEMPAQNLTVVIRGGLPDAAPVASHMNGSGKPNGHAGNGADPDHT